MYCFINKRAGILYIISIITLLYIYRTVIPFFKYPFVVFYLFFIVYTIIAYKKQLTSGGIAFLRNNILILFLLIIFFYSLYNSSKIYLIVFKNIVDTIIILSFFYVYSIYVRDKTELKRFVNDFYRGIFLFSFIISVYYLLDTFNINKAIESSGIIVDYNFVTIPIFFGLISGIKILPDVKLLRYRVLISLVLLAFCLLIFMLGSRRAMIVLLLFWGLIIVSQLTFIFRNNFLLKRLASQTRILFILFVLLIISLHIFSNYISHEGKDKFLLFLGSKNVYATKKQISDNAARSLSIINHTVKSEDLYEKIWSPVFNANDPSSGWGFEYYKAVYPLTGKNYNFIPSEAIGCLVDSGCFMQMDALKKNSIYSLIKKIQVKEGEKYKASIYCFVSEEYDGGTIRLMLGWDAINKNVVEKNVISSYDIGDKGSWQKLEIEFNCNNGEVPIYISIQKQENKDLSKAKGFVIFAYPQIFDAEIEISDLSLNKVLNVHMNKYYKIINNNKHSLGLPNQYFKANALLSIAQIVTDNNDPARNFLANLIHEDTTYYPYKMDLLIIEKGNRLDDPRLKRWKFTYQIFTKEYNWKQKLFGGGFDHLNWFGYYFYNDKTRIDWPHNPFLSVLLYSGILGLALYLFVFYKALYYYIKYLREYYIFFIFFLVAFFFSFFSGDSPFSPPIMGFLLIFPYFIHSLHKKEEQDKKVIEDCKSEVNNG